MIEKLNKRIDELEKEIQEKCKSEKQNHYK